MPRRSRLRAAALRALAVIVAIGFTLLLLEVAIRAAYPALPPGLQIALRFVRLHPFTDQRMAPLPIWRSDRDYQTIVEPDVRDVEQVGSLSVRFRVSTYRWWNGRVGFRTPQPETGRVEAAAVGDSHTFCFVDEQECWVNLLSAQIGIQIANLGQPVTGSVSHARLYEDMIGKLPIGQPRLVLWQFFGNDFNDDYGLAVLNGQNKTPSPAEPDDTPPSNPWLAENSAIYALITALNRSGSAQNALFVDPYRAEVGGAPLYFGRPYITQSFDMMQARNQEGEALSYEALLRTRDMVERNGGKFVVLLMPAKEEVYRPITEPQMGSAALEGIAAPRLHMLDFCGAHQLTCFDALAALEAERAKLLFHPDDLHMNAEGNRAFAEAVAAFLRAQRIIG